MKKKTVLPMGLVALLCVCTFDMMKPHAADVTNFNIHADSSWGQGYAQESEKLFSYTANGDLTELETQVGYYNYHQAKREHIFNFTTAIEGILYSL